jgi:queuine tRNA-ribosyltransferase
MSREILAYHLNTIHNLYYFVGLMRSMRKAIEDDTFLQFRNNFYALQEGDD